MAPERLNGSNYSYGADIWRARMAQSCGRLLVLVAS